MERRGAHGFSIIENLVALSLMAVVTAALLPGIALAARLQRDSAIETEAAVIAAARLEHVKAGVAAGVIGTGGALDAPMEGWHVMVDREGEPAERGAFDSRWQVTPATAPAGVLIVLVRAVPLADVRGAVTLSTAVAHE